MDNSRITALNILIDYEKNGTYPNLTLKGALRKFKDDRERRFTCAIVYGVIERKLTLDYYISRISSIKIRKISIPVLTLLRMGAYQIMYMNVPDIAACNSTVTIAKQNGMARSAGFINAILRRLCVGYQDIPLPSDADERMTVQYSVSPQVLKIVQDSLGAPSAKRYFESSFNKADDIYACVNPVKCTDDQVISELIEDGINAEKTEMSHLIHIDRCGDIESLAVYREGKINIISKPSFLTAMAVVRGISGTVYDLCAAPGGKTFAMSALCNNVNITAFDIHEHKIENLNKSIERLGVTNVKCTKGDSSVANPALAAAADSVLCDVPCSGLGMINKKPDLKYKDVNISSLTDLQLRILNNGSGYVKPGGRLVYSTCTVNKSENIDVVNKFLEQNSAFQIDKSVIIYDNIEGEFLFLPENGYSEGFYVAVMKKKGC